MKPSILIPTKNRAARLRHALESCDAQTRECEIVVVDGGSTDETPSVVFDFECASHRFERDPGFLPCWYTAAALASGVIVHYQLDDDWIEPSFMERTVPLLAEDVGVVLTQALIHFDDGRPDALNLEGMPDHDCKIPSSELLNALLNHLSLTITPACATLRRETVLDWLPVGRIPGVPRRTNCADAFLMLCAIASRPYVAWVADPLAHLGAHSDGYTISRMDNGHKQADLENDYRSVKNAWKRLLCAMTLAAIVTTINPPTSSVRKLSQRAGRVIVIGDRKGPLEYDVPGCEFYALEEQRSIPSFLERMLPVDHFARKNIGAMLAIRGGASCIYETDDDNAPLMLAWKPRERCVTSAAYTEGAGWFNVWQAFSSATIWPRGLPLAYINRAPDLTSRRSWTAPIQQGLANVSPDTDAIWRLTVGGEHSWSRTAASVALQANQWCPINSQSTWWWPEAYPLLYLPSTVNGRLSDIWRGLIAQRCLWGMGGVVVHHGAEVEQIRNPHNTMQDFADEVPGYLHNEEIGDILGALELGGDMRTNICRCWGALADARFVERRELALLDAWLRDIS